MRLISPHKPLNLLVIGGQRVGKQYLVELFVASESKSSPDRADKTNSMCSQEIIKSTPVDLLIDEKLYRMASIDIKTFTRSEGQERIFLNENLNDKHGVIFMYKERGTAGHATANRMFDMVRGKIPCVLAHCDTNDYVNEYSIRSSYDAFLAFEALIRVFKSE